MDRDKILETFKKWEPQCVNETFAAEGKSFGTSAKGYITPCCWIDLSYYSDYETLKNYDPKIAILFKEHLKIENNESIEEILLSDEWQEFRRNLNSLDTAPKQCKKQCFRNTNTSLNKTPIKFRK